MTMRYSQRALVSALFLGFAWTSAAQSDNTGGGKGGLSAADTVFIENAAKDGMAEVQMGQMAISKSSDDQVKQLAQHIVDDHTKANVALKTLAESKKVSFPSNTANDAQKQSDGLKATKGTSFDQAWSKAMVKDHQDAIKMFTDEGKQTKDTDIQQFVKTTLPTLKSHLESAQKLAAVPDARDKAMDQATKSMSSTMDNTPASVSTAKASAAIPVPAPTAATGAKH
ncbi:DUF4142 domain-containing protein [Rhodanobacter sp. MP1X3]|uniref:DUF4142 domain-containing protein n=1 Tax=Rhodanobacter sp. MP1X3 TaxID=2723086 RepID=UPI00161829EF|nr:DUF4142 domain-containing protein [Rhodanobacter sp. MP1X3]MBB6242607.1 putative membrane protein [Rhodanobacter sp. MP1X3]